jgi:hypothetical protein
MVVLSWLIFENSVGSLLRSDDCYVAAFVVTVPVTAFYAIGTTAGWWFRSTRIAWIATIVPLAGCGLLLWLVDSLHDFGEGDQIVGYLGIGMLLGGACGSVTFLVKRHRARLVLSLVPHLSCMSGYLLALTRMHG